MQYTVKHLGNQLCNRLGRFILIVGLVLLPLLASAQREAIDLANRGPQVGDTIPEFSLPDQNGEAWTNESIIGPNGTMLVFIRSADW
tara:strand:- start:91 stop:351 length:261 start_codon:yes stop_codon:yes gene_type:complete